MAGALQEHIFIKLFKFLNDHPVYLSDLVEQNRVRRLVQQLISGNNQSVKEAREYLLSLQESCYPIIAAFYAAQNFSIRSITLRNIADFLLPVAVLIAGTCASRDPLDSAENSAKRLVFELLILAFLTLYALYQFYSLGKQLVQLAQNRHDVLKDLITFVKNSTNTTLRLFQNFTLAFFSTNSSLQSSPILDVTPLLVNNIQQLKANELLNLYKQIFPANVLQLENVPQLTR